MVVGEYFFDTYALIEIIKGNPSYAKFSAAKVNTSQYNLIELYYTLYCEFGEKTAKMIYNKYKECIVEINDDVIFEAIACRKQHIKKGLSYVDCIGYVYAKKNNLKFLTGDKEFKNIDNVEFVPKN